jgi:hypothetical protein
LLAIADIANFAIGHVIPGQGRAKGGCDSYLGVRHRFSQFVACHRRIVAKYRRCAATRGATAAGLHVWQYAVKNMLAIQRARGGAVISAESTRLAAVAAAL